MVQQNAKLKNRLYLRKLNNNSNLKLIKMSKKCNQYRVKVVKVNDTVEVGSKGFKKRELEAIIEGEYPQELMFEFTQDNVDLLDTVIEGSYVTVSYNIRTNRVEKDGKVFYFTSLNGWKIEM